MRDATAWARASVALGASGALRALGALGDRCGSREIDDRLVDAGFWLRAGVGRGDAEKIRQTAPRERRSRETSRRSASGGSRLRLDLVSATLGGCWRPRSKSAPVIDGSMIGRPDRSTRSNGSIVGCDRGAMGAIGARCDGCDRCAGRRSRFAPVAPVAPIAPVAPVAPANAAAKSPRALRAHCVERRRARASRRAPLRTPSGCPPKPACRSPPRTRSRRANRRPTAIAGDAYCGRVGSFAPTFDNAAAIPKPVMRAASAAEHDVAQMQQAVVHAARRRRDRWRRRATRRAPRHRESTSARARAARRRANRRRRIPARDTRRRARGRRQSARQCSDD